MIWAELSEADLTGAKGVTKEQLERAAFPGTLESATMPDGQTLKGERTSDGPIFEEWLKRSKGRGEDG
jgi:hypothetical protein